MGLAGGDKDGRTWPGHRSNCSLSRKGSGVRGSYQQPGGSGCCPLLWEPAEVQRGAAMATPSEGTSGSFSSPHRHQICDLKSALIPLPTGESRGAP